ncbi:MAG: AlpA family phage regulatory protein [Gammaproteobacteria bacterium]|nr:AlpA family phage regulatory protein [Gammaproteobacteria bacterium]
MKTETQLLRVGQVIEILGISRTTLHRMVKEKRFPKPIELGPQARRWRIKDVQAWLDSA